MSEEQTMSEFNQSGDNSHGKKRKKKRSANQMAKKFARRRDTSDHGFELEADTYQYMLRILEILRTEFSTMDDKLNFVNNVFEQTIGHEVELAKNQVGSRVMESLLDHASLDVIRRIMDAFNSSLRPMCSDRFGSHVVERLVYVCVDRGNKVLETDVKKKKKKKRKDDDDDGDGDDKSEENAEVEVKPTDLVEYNRIALILCKYVLNNIEEFIYDTYANHIMRTAIKCLGGQFDGVKDHGQKKIPPATVNSKVVGEVRPVQEEYKSLLVFTGKRISKWPQLAEFGKDPITSGFLQVLLRSLINVEPKLTSEIIERMSNECFTGNTNEKLSTIFDCVSSLRLLETCLEVATPELLKKLYEKYFMNNLKQLSVDSSTIFSVHKLLESCKDKELFELIFDQLVEHFDDLVKEQNSRVLVALVESCLRLQSKQGPFVNAFFKCLGCEKADRQLSIAPLAARLATYDQYDAAKKGSRNISLHINGSLIVQAILNFNKPIKMINSILAMTGEDLASFFGDPKGSRILDNFMDSKYVGEKSRDKLAKLLKGHWVELACGIHGSRCLDKVWQHSKENQKLHIMEELASVGEVLKSTKVGRIIYNKFNVGLYARNKKEWVEGFNREEKTKTLFADIITGANDKKFIKS